MITKEWIQSQLEAFYCEQLGKTEQLAEKYAEIILEKVKSSDKPSKKIIQLIFRWWLTQ